MAQAMLDQAGYYEQPVAVVEDQGHIRANKLTTKNISSGLRRGAKRTDSSTLFDAPPIKSQRNDAAPRIEIDETNYTKLLTIRDGVLILKCCRVCAQNLFNDKEKFRFQDGRIFVEINFCERCASGLIAAANSGTKPRASFFEKECFKLVKVHYGVIVARICVGCQQHLFVDDILHAKNGAALRAEIAFCRDCAAYNMDLCEALSVYFPYTANTQKNYNLL